MGGAHRGRRDLAACGGVNCCPGKDINMPKQILQFLKKAIYIILLGILSIIFIGPTLPLDVSLLVIFSLLGFLGFGQKESNFLIGDYLSLHIRRALRRLGLSRSDRCAGTRD